MLTAEEYQWLWQAYIGAGIGLILLIVYITRNWKKYWQIRYFIVLAAMVCTFSIVTINSAGNKSPAFVVLILDTVIMADGQTQEAPMVLARNIIIATIVFFTTVILRYIVTRR